MHILAQTVIQILDLLPKIGCHVCIAFVVLASDFLSGRGCNNR